MKYFTKEYYQIKFLTDTVQHVRQLKSTEQINEKFYRFLYEKQYNLFSFFEKTSDFYHDRTEDLRRIEAYANDANITDEERGFRKDFKELYEYLYGNNLRSKKVFEFDEEMCRRKFAERINSRIELYRQLPQKILDKIADIRVFALGYTSAEVKHLLRPYCAIKRSEIKEIEEKAHRETDRAESHLSEIIGFNEYEEVLLTGIEERNGDILLKVDRVCILSIKDGEILEGNGKTIYPYDEERPNCPWSRIVASELHRSKGKFKVQFLVANNNEIGQTDLWYLTVRGTDITATDDIATVDFTPDL